MKHIHPLGRLLKHWRTVRHMSQLDLALHANVSARHVSFIETGRSRPSREMVLQLAGALELPLRESNVLLEAAGFAQVYRQTDLEDPALAQARQALDFILKAHEPYPALVLDRYWNIVMSNPPSMRVLGHFMADPAAITQPPNAVRLTFDPNGLRPFIVDWEPAAAFVIDRVHRDALGGAPDEGTMALLDEVLSYPGVPAEWALPNLDQPPAPLLPVSFERDSVRVDLFTMMTTFGTPQDVTLQELRIESFYPANPESEAALARISGDA